ncbi:MAG: magnesium transporter [Pseudomonadota bacterium]
MAPLPGPSDDPDFRDIARTAPDEAARILKRMPATRATALAHTLNETDRAEVLALLEHPPGTVGSLVTPRCAKLPPTLSAGEAVNALAGDGRAETVYAAFVVDDQGKFLGTVDLRTLITAPSDAPVQTLMDRNAPFARLNESAIAVARRTMAARDLATPVIDDGGHLVGMVTYDDAHREFSREVDNRVDHFNALNATPEPDHYLDISFYGEIYRRAPWIVSLSVLGLMAGYVVHAYESALDALVILALYMPLVADTGGNVGTQAASLVLRAAATGSVAVKDTARVLWKETRVALVMAAILFVFACLKVWFFSGNADVPGDLTLTCVGLAIASAIGVAAFVAVVIGAMLPLLGVVLRIDPAVFAGPALTTIVDVVGLFIYFKLTTWILGLELAAP